MTVSFYSDLIFFKTQKYAKNVLGYAVNLLVILKINLFLLFFTKTQLML